MQLGVLIIGDEILSGRRTDKHLGYSIALFKQRQLTLNWVRMCGDDASLLTRQFREIHSSGDLCFSFGGIGATPDDLTRRCMAEAHAVPLHRHPAAQAAIEQQFGDAAFPHRVRMADLPRGSSIIPNPVNRIPGFSLGHIHCLPGFPQMAWPMMRWLLDERYRRLPRARPVEFALTVQDAHESELLDWMDAFVKQNPDLKIFSLPRFLKQGGCEIELGIKGERHAAQAALQELRSMLDEKNYRYREQ